MGARTMRLVQRVIGSSKVVQQQAEQWSEEKVGRWCGNWVLGKTKVNAEAGIRLVRRRGCVSQNLSSQGSALCNSRFAVHVHDSVNSKFNSLENSLVILLMYRHQRLRLCHCFCHHLERLFHLRQAFALLLLDDSWSKCSLHSTLELGRLS